MNETVSRGIVIKQNSCGDANRLLTIFTENDGIIKAVRYGMRGKKTNNAAAFQMLCYGDFLLRPSGTMMTAVGCEVIDGFYPVSENITKLSLLSYLADITYWLLGEGNPDKRVLSLFLNTVYAAAYRDEPCLKLKTVYELKMMSAGGYMPRLSVCGVCGGVAQYFSPAGGEVVCRAHRRAEDMPISAHALELARYIVSCPDKKMLSFSVKDEEVYGELGRITERYVSVQTDRKYPGLDYFYVMLNNNL